MKDGGIADIIRRGMRPLLDKDGELRQLQLPPVEPPVPPTQAQFLEVVNDFWYHGVWTAKKWRREELWEAKWCCDVYMKRLLLKMMRWHAHALHDWGYDIWFRGRFLEQWADPRILTSPRDALATYAEQDVRRALMTTMEMFRWLQIQVAEHLAIPSPLQPLNAVANGWRIVFQATVTCTLPEADKDGTPPIRSVGTLGPGPVTALAEATSSIYGHER